MVNTDFESLMVMKSNREERMNTILYNDSRKLNDMHQKFLERLFYEKKDKKTAMETRKRELLEQGVAPEEIDTIIKEEMTQTPEQERKWYLENIEQRPVFKTKQGECTFWRKL